MDADRQYNPELGRTASRGSNPPHYDVATQNGVRKAEGEEDTHTCRARMDGQVRQRADAHCAINSLAEQADLGKVVHGDPLHRCVQCRPSFIRLASADRREKAEIPPPRRTPKLMRSHAHQQALPSWPTPIRLTAHRLGSTHRERLSSGTTSFVF